MSGTKPKSISISRNLTQSHPSKKVALAPNECNPSGVSLKVRNSKIGPNCWPVEIVSKSYFGVTTCISEPQMTNKSYFEIQYPISRSSILSWNWLGKVHNLYLRWPTSSPRTVNRQLWEIRWVWKCFTFENSGQNNILGGKYFTK